MRGFVVWVGSMSGQGWDYPDWNPWEVGERLGPEALGQEVVTAFAPSLHPLVMVHCAPPWFLVWFTSWTVEATDLESGRDWVLFSKIFD